MSRALPEVPLRTPLLGPLSATERAQTTHASNLWDIAQSQAVRWVEGQRSLDRAVRTALERSELTPRELLGLQAAAYRFGQEVELAAKVVERTTRAAQRIAETQV
ncbi:MAG: hypothetical protein ACFB9M_05745 [Myxococcota bacterium]